jgi:hypothetical protein
MFKNMYNLFFEDCFKSFDIYRKNINTSNDLYFDVENEVKIGTIDVDIQEKTKLITSEGKQKNEAGTYVVKYTLGYASPTASVEIGDILKNTNKNYEVVNVFDKKDFILLYLKEVV